MANLDIVAYSVSIPILNCPESKFETDLSSPLYPAVAGVCGGGFLRLSLVAR